MKRSSRERRKAERLRLKITALCSIDGKALDGYCLDISPGGIKLEVIGEIPIGSRAMITLDTTPPLKLSGISRWCKKEGLHSQCGIEFSDLSAEQESKLRAVIQSLFWENFG